MRSILALGFILFFVILPKFFNINTQSFISTNALASISGVFNYDEVKNPEKSLYNNQTHRGQDSYNLLNSINLPVLQAAVNIDPSPAKGGGDINIVDNVALASESGVVGTVLDIEKTNNRGRISLYEVREGDTISQIGEMFGVSVNTIRWANDITGSIQPGQSLVILPVNGLTHVVKNGGTIVDVAKIYKADAAEIALFNGLDLNAALKPGDEIIVPNVDPRIENNKPNNSNQPQNTRVVSGNSTSQTSGNYFTNPVPGGIITQGIHGYNSIDIAAPYGTPVLAAAAGKVLTSREGGWNGGYGNYLVISHENGSQTLYSHNSRNTVYVGQFVEKGEVVGYVGSTGRSTGNHLHFEVRGGTNPLASCRVGSVCR